MRDPIKIAKVATVAALVMLIATLSATNLPASCTYVYHVDQDPEMVCSPDYYTVLTSEPDWCQFAYGDWVLVRWQVVGGVLTLTGWYVIPAADTTSHPPQDFGQYPQDVVGQNCNLIWLPW